MARLLNQNSVTGHGTMGVALTSVRSGTRFRLLEWTCSSRTGQRTTFWIGLENSGLAVRTYASLWTAYSRRFTSLDISTPLMERRRRSLRDCRPCSATMLRSWARIIVSTRSTIHGFWNGTARNSLRYRGNMLFRPQAMKLYDYIPEALLMQRIEEGYVNVNQHKKFPLAIYTYSKSATFDYVWDEATCKCRGLIVDLRDMTIRARSFEKFFNFGEKAGITREQFPETYPIITEKLDGNLITLYQWQG